jgi:gluconate:H+ symporter, GntP family
MHWAVRDTVLVVWTLIGITVVVVLITWAKMHAFLALILGSLLVGLGARLSTADTIKNFESGLGAVV